MKRRRGYSLVEVVISLLLLTIVFTALSGAAVRYAHQVLQTGVRAAALEMVNDRLEQVRLHPRYEEIAEVFVGTEYDINDVPDALRTTEVLRQVDTLDSGGVVDVTYVTVEVARPGMPDAVRRTVVVGAP